MKVIKKECNIVYIILVQGFGPLKIEITPFPEGFLIISCLIEKEKKEKWVAGLNNRFCCTYWTKIQRHLRMSYDFAHLAELALVIQKIDNPIHSTNLYPVDSAVDPYSLSTEQ